MKIENLEKGNEIQERLEFLRLQKIKFEISENLWSDKFETRQREKTNSQVSNLSREFIDFDVIRTLALQKISDEIKKLEQEFEEL
jgi:hypothetical protein